MYTGPEKRGTNAGFRHLYNSVLTLMPAAKLNAYVEALLGLDRRIGGADQWSGLAAAAQFSLTKKWRLGGRLERFNDTTGFNTGTPQHLVEGTATLDYRPRKLLIVRSELRRDLSDQSVFEKDNTPRASKEQTTLLVGLIFMLKIER